MDSYEAKRAAFEPSAYGNSDYTDAVASLKKQLNTRNPLWDKLADDTSFAAPADAHESSRKFYAVLAEAAKLHDKKQRDYGSDSDPFANVRASEDFGIPAWLGCIIRGNDKVRRLQTYATTGVLANEGVEDALIDLCVYAAIALVLFREHSAE